MQRKFFQNTIAIVYDFDGTLSPQPMQEYTVLPKIGIDSKTFWSGVNEEAHKTGSDSMLVYMRLMLREANKREVSIKREDFAKLARSIEYFPGVETWFSRINTYVKRRGAGKVKVQHYIISAGQKEILDGVSIRKHFKQIYASEYHFDHNGVADFPKVLINDTTKTQFLSGHWSAADTVSVRREYPFQLWRTAGKPPHHRPTERVHLSNSTP